ncbi:MAG: CoA transferase [Reyranella sp.]|nr:CoA transferase [Reyranella sp.]
MVIPRSDPIATTTPASDELDASSAMTYARRLLDDLGRVAVPAGEADHPALSWVCSGLAELTGYRGGAPLVAPIGLSAAADGALAALSALAGQDRPFGTLTGATLLGERGRIAEFTRQGSISPGGGCRLLPTQDGMLAVSLVRPSDWELMPAWTGEDIGDWKGLTPVLRKRPTAEWLEQGRLLGLALADADLRAAPSEAWHETIVQRPGHPARRRGPRVVDLSALWAGPLCADLLGRLGGSVIKVESQGRPDGARTGAPDFYGRLNGGKSSVALDFTDTADRAVLLNLIQSADIVVEGSRPRALRQLGIHADEIVASSPGVTWISITGHGRSTPGGDWTGFGDDAAVAAGLSRLMRDAHGEWLFCGDAIADPLTGIHAALLAWNSWQTGGSALHSISLKGVVASVIARDSLKDASTLRSRTARWQTIANGADLPLYELPAARGVVEASGASNQIILAGSQPC